MYETPVIQKLAVRIPLGIYTAMHRNSFGDQGAAAGSVHP